MPNTPRILIVDDDASQRSLLDSFLRSQGYQFDELPFGDLDAERRRQSDVPNGRPANRAWYRPRSRW